MPKTQPFRSAGQTIARLAGSALAAAALAAVLPGVLGHEGLAQGSGCLPPISNPVACENALPGNPQSEWDVTGAGDTSIQGFATDISVNHGETVDFKVKTDSTQYRIDVYRLGYYGGAGARKVATVLPSAALPQTQPSCLTDSATGLVDCGNWAVSASWAVPSDATSGVYIARLVRIDNGGASHMVFIVRDDEHHSDLLFQTSDTTWQAYNDYGGNSLYSGSPAGRAYKVSYNRPFVTRGNQFARAWLFDGDYPMLRWLEANGYFVSYTTGADTDRRGAELLEHKAFLSVGHDEYWSAGQRTNVEAARAAGVHLAFFSGNEMFWKTRWENSLSSPATSYRTLVSYKETHANAKIDPDAAWTGTWRDPRFSPPADGGQPENALTGTIFMGNCCGTLALTVSETQGKARFWRNTSLATLGVGQSANVAAGIVGYEFDADLDNGFRPQGLIRLSATTANYGATLLDYGSTYGNGSITHALTLYRHSSGALVFGAGLTRWGWALDTTHDLDSATPGILTATDPTIQQATVNLFADMGSQPLTLQPGLTASSASSDTTGPSTSITSPAGGANLNVESALTITGTASDAAGIVGGVEVSVDGGTTWTAATGTTSWTFPWTPHATGTATIKSRGVDDSGNIGAVTTTTVNVVNPACPCTLWPVSATPAGIDTNGSSPLELGVKFRSDLAGYITAIRFYKGPTSTGAHTASLWTSGGTLLATAPFTGETGSGWQEVTLPAPVAVTANTTYVASYHTADGIFAFDGGYFNSAARDASPLHAPASPTVSGNGVFAVGATAFPTQSFNGNNYWTDVVFTLSLETPPTVLSTTPVNNDTAISPATVVTATFSEAMDGATITGSTFELCTPANALVPATLAYNSGTHVATLTPSVSLSNSTTYTARIVGGSSGVKDLTGTALVTDMVWSFTTGAAFPCPCNLWPGSTTPTAFDSSGSTPLEVGVKFTSEVGGFITGLRFYKNAASTGVHTGHLWSSGGVLLATAQFSETASGWQEVTLPSPIAIAANTTYVASYATSDGHFSFDSGYFAANGRDASPLHAPASPTASGNGVFAVSAGVFPNQTFNGNNYWADVVFSLSGDSTPPTVTAMVPTNGATGVAGTTVATATFSEAMNPSTVTTSTVELRDVANALVSASVSYDVDTRVATLQPAGTLASGAVYTARVIGGASGVKDLAGNPLAADATASFTVADTVAPTVTGMTPTNGAINVAVSTAVTVVFSENVDAATVSTSTIELRDALNAPVAANVNYNAGTQTATLTPIAALASTTTYTVRVVGGASGVKDPAGNPVVSDVVQTFTTADVVAPTVIAMTPPDGSAGVTESAVVTATFSENVDAATISAATFELRDGANALIASTLSYNAGTHTAMLQPTSALNALSPYTARVFGGPSGVKDLAGNALESTATTSFVTADTVLPTVTSTTPSNGATGVAASTAVTVVFSEAVQSGTVTTATIELRDDLNALVPATVGYDNGTHTATLQPASALASHVTYTTRVVSGASGVKDLGGNALAADFTASFVTVDTVAPAVTGMSPVNGATSVAGSTAVTASFSEDVDAATVTASSLELRDGANALVSAVVSYSSGTHTATLQPSSALASSATYTARVVGGALGVKDPAGNPLPGDVTTTFTIADTIAPTVTNLSPANGATGVPLSAAVTVIFSEDINAATVTTSTIELRDSGNALVPATVSYNGGTHTATLQPLSPLVTSSSDTSRVVGGASGVKDVAGNALAADVSATFISADVIAPFVTVLTPVNGAVAVSGTTAVSATFSEDLNAATVNASTLELRDGANSLVSAVVTYNAGTRTATLQPASPLVPSAIYHARVVGGPGGVTDLEGNPLAVDVLASFTTAALAPSLGARTTGTYNSGDSGESTTITDAITTQESTSFVMFITGDLETNPVITDTYNNTWTQVGKATQTGEDTSGSRAFLWTYVALGGHGGPNHIFTVQKYTGFTSVIVTEVLGDAVLEAAAIGADSQSPFESPAVAVSDSALLVSAFGYGFPDAYVEVVHGNGFTGLDLISGGEYWNIATSARTVLAGTYNASDELNWVDGGSPDTPYATALLALRSRPGPGDTTPPSVTAIAPSSGTVGVPATVNPSITFSEALDVSTVNHTTVELRDSSNAIVAAAVSIDGATHVATIRPDYALTSFTSYTVRVVGGSTGVKDLTGNALAADATSSFTTGLAAPSIGARATGAYNRANSDENITMSTFPIVTQPVTNFVMFLAGDNNAAFPVPVISDTYGNSWTQVGNALPNGGLGQGTEGRFWTFVSLGAKGGPNHAFTSLNYHEFTSMLVVEVLSDITLADSALATDSASPFESPALTLATNSLLVAATTVGFPDSFATFENGNGFLPLNVVTMGDHWGVASSYRAAPAGTFNTSVTTTLTGGIADMPAATALLAFVPDQIPPSATAVTPTSETTQVATNTIVTATFSERLRAASVTSGTFELRNGSNAVVPASVTYDDNTLTATLTPLVELPYGDTMTARLVAGANGITDRAGNPLTFEVTWFFTTVVPSISIDDITVAEPVAVPGNTSQATFTVTLSQPSPTTTTTVAYTAGAGSATSGQDFAATSGTVTFDPGVTSQTISVPVLADPDVEASETFSVNLSAPVHGTISKAQGTALITDTAVQSPALTIADVSTTEADSGQTDAVLTVTLSSASFQTVTVGYTTTAGTATAGEDFTTTSGTLTFTSGATQQSIVVPVLGDTTSEFDESLTVTLSGAVYATIADGQASVTILDTDPLPALSAGDLAISEGDSGTANAQVTVTLSAVSGRPVTVAYATTAGTATAGSDYTSTSGTLTIPAGSPSGPVLVPVVGDLLNEVDETLTLTLSSPTNATIAQASATVTIGNNDSLPTVSIGSISTTEGNSGTSAVQLAVTLSAASGRDVSVTYATTAGTATADVDYATTGGTLTIPAGATSGVVTVLVAGDVLSEIDETFAVGISAPVNATIGQATGTATIVNDDSLPTLSIGAASLTEGNSGTANVNVPVTLSTASGQTVTVAYATAAGTATAGSDYTTTSGTLIIPAGVTAMSIDVPIAGDATVEADETFTVTLSAPTAATITTSQATVTITNDDLPTISIANGSVTEGNTGSLSLNLTVTLSSTSPQTVTAAYATANNTAVSGADYTAKTGTVTFTPGSTSQIISVSVLGDTLDEINETFFVNLSDPTNAAILSGQSIVTITDNDATPSLVISNATVAESAVATLTVTLSAASGQTVTVNYATAIGTASAADFVAGSGTLTFAPGVTTQPVVVVLVNDALDEGNETVLVNLTSPTNASVSDSQGVITISDNDPTPTLQITDATATEGDTGTSSVVLTVTLSAVSGRSVSVNYTTANGTATTADYVTASGTLTFAAGVATQQITVSIRGDLVNEATETFNVNLSAASNATILDAQGAVTILDNDPVPVLTLSSPSITEGNAASKNLTFTVTLSTASGQAVSAAYATADGTALAGSDYTAKTGTVSVAAGSTTGTFTVSILGDLVVEPDETFVVNLSSPVNVTLGSAQGTGTITNDD